MNEEKKTYPRSNKMTHPIDKSNSNVTTKHSMTNKNNLCGSSTVQFRSLTPDWLMNLKLGGNTAIRSTLWSPEVTQLHFLKTILAYPKLGGNTAIRSTLWSPEVTQLHFLKTILAYPNLMLSEEEN